MHLYGNIFTTASKLARKNICRKQEEMEGTLLGLCSVASKVISLLLWQILCFA